MIKNKSCKLFVIEENEENSGKSGINNNRKYKNIQNGEI